MPEACVHVERIGELTRDPHTAFAALVAHPDEPDDLRGETELPQDVPEAWSVKAIVCLLVIHEDMPGCFRIFVVFFIDESNYEDVVYS